MPEQANQVRGCARIAAVPKHVRLASNPSRRGFLGFSVHLRLLAFGRLTVMGLHRLRETLQQSVRRLRVRQLREDISGGTIDRLVVPLPTLPQSVESGVRARV